MCLPDQCQSLALKVLHELPLNTLPAPWRERHSYGINETLLTYESFGLDV